MTRPPDLLDTTERIAALLAEQGIQAMVIGAAAMAAHRYVRHTEDIDLGVNVPIRDLATVAGSLRAVGLEAIFREPDGQDPLGGVIDITGDFGLVQIVNFGDRFPAIIDSGLATATLRTRDNPLTCRENCRSRSAGWPAILAAEARRPPRLQGR